MERNEVKKILYDILSENTDANLNEEGNLSDLGMDSLESIEMVINIEKEFDMTIEDEISGQFNGMTLGEIVDVIHKKMK